MFFSGGQSGILLKNFDNFPSNFFTIITVVKFDNLLTNDVKKLTTSYFASVAQQEKKERKKSIFTSEIQEISDDLIEPDKSNLIIQTPEFKRSSLRSTLLTLKSLNADYFEIFVDVGGNQTSLCLVSFSFLLFF